MGGILVDVFVQTHSSVDFLSLVIRMFFLVQGGYLLHKTFYDQLLDRKGDIYEYFLHLLFLNHLYLKKMNMPKWCLWGWHVLTPSLGISSPGCIHSIDKYLLIAYYALGANDTNIRTRSLRSLAQGAFNE